MSCSICSCLFKSSGDMTPYTLPCGEAICKGCLGRSLKGGSVFKCSNCGEEHDKSEININWDVVSAEEDIEKRKRTDLKIQNDPNIEFTSVLSMIPMFNTNRYTKKTSSSSFSSALHKKYVCYTCYKSFEYYDDLTDHIEKEGHKKLFDKGKTFRCDVCDSVFPSYEEYRIHLDKSKHSTLEVHKCNYPGCNMKFPREEELIKHIRECGHALVQGKSFTAIQADRYAPVATESGDTLYYSTLTQEQLSAECRRHTCFTFGCGKTFDMRVEFDEHVKSEHDGKCPNVNLTFRKLENIQKIVLGEFPNAGKRLYAIVSESKTFDDFCLDLSSAVRKVIELFESVLSGINEKVFYGKLKLSKVNATRFKECFTSAHDFDLFSFFFETLHVRKTIQNPYVLHVVVYDMCYFLGRVLLNIKRPRPSAKGNTKPKEPQQNSEPKSKEQPSNSSSSSSSAMSEHKIAIERPNPASPPKESAQSSHKVLIERPKPKSTATTTTTATKKPEDSKEPPQSNPPHKVLIERPKSTTTTTTTMTVKKPEDSKEPPQSNPPQPPHKVLIERPKSTSTTTTTTTTTAAKKPEGPKESPQSNPPHKVLIERPKSTSTTAAKKPEDSKESSQSNPPHKVLIERPKKASVPPATNEPKESSHKILIERPKKASASTATTTETKPSKDSSQSPHKILIERPHKN